MLFRSTDSWPDAADSALGMPYPTVWGTQPAGPGQTSLSPAYMVDQTSSILLVAGHETTMNLISGSLLQLARQPEMQDTLRHHPELDRSATDEFLRLVAPVQLTGRALLDDVSVGGVVIPKGHFVFVLIGAANRDPSVFSHPTELQLDRDPNPHLGFGFGLHHCLGAPLARLESSIVVRELLNATTSFQLCAPSVAYRPNIILRGLESLPLRCEA